MSNLKSRVKEWCKWATDWLPDDLLAEGPPRGGTAIVLPPELNEFNEIDLPPEMNPFNEAVPGAKVSVPKAPDEAERARDRLRAAADELQQADAASGEPPSDDARALWRARQEGEQRDTEARNEADQRRHEAQGRTFKGAQLSVALADAAVREGLPVPALRELAELLREALALSIAHHFRTELPAKLDACWKAMRASLRGLADVAASKRSSSEVRVLQALVEFQRCKITPTCFMVAKAAGCAERTVRRTKAWKVSQRPSREPPRGRRLDDGTIERQGGKVHDWDDD